MPQQESAPPTDAAAATLTPASLIADGRYTRATCGMDRELLAMLRAAVKEDPAALRRLCTKLSNNAAARLGGATARVSIIVAPPLGPPTCVYLKPSLPHVAKKKSSEYFVLCGEY